MQAIKRIFIFCLALCMVITTGCSNTALETNNKEPDILAENLEKETTYRLHEAQPQSIGREMELSVFPTYCLQKSVRTDHEYMLVDLMVGRNDNVKKGDVVAVMQGLGSKIDVEQKRLERDVFAAGVVETEAYYMDLLTKAEALPASTESEAAIRELKIEYARADLELYKLQSAQSLKMMDDAISDMENAAGEVHIYSPVDGQIRTVTSYKEGEIVPAGTELCIVYEADSQRIYGQSGNGTYVYGREVEVTLGRNENKKTYIGRVVSSPEVQNDEYYSTDIYIRLEETVDKRSSDGRAIASYTVLDGVIAVPSNALTILDGRANVQILEGDSVRTRSVVRGPIVGNTVAILQGLEVGDQVVVSSYNS